MNDHVEAKHHDADNDGQDAGILQRFQLQPVGYDCRQASGHDQNCEHGLDEREAGCHSVCL